MKNKKRLIAQIARNLAETPSAAAKPTRTVGTPSRSPNESPSTKAGEAGSGPNQSEGSSAPRSTASGKQAAFWLDDEDRAIFHETGMILYSQGIKPSHNLVLRAAIRMIPRDHRLVEKVRELIEKDGRKLRHQKK